MNIVQESRFQFILDQAKYRGETKVSIQKAVRFFEDRGVEIQEFCPDSLIFRICKEMSRANHFPDDRKVLRALEKLQKEFHEAKEEH